MKCTLTLIVLMVVGFGSFFLPTNVIANDATCFVVTDSQWGKGCSADPNSLLLTVQNVCDKTMSLLSCMGQEGGKPSCLVKENIKAKASLEVSACNATGSYVFTGCERARDCNKALEMSQQMGPKPPR